MTNATRYFLGQLRAFIDSRPAKRRELQKLHEKLCDGRKLHRVAISRHLYHHVTPLMDTGIVYLRFAQMNGIIRSALPEVGLFTYRNTEEDKPKAKKRSK